MEYLYKEEDTIVALSTPLGPGAIAVIRLSGANSLSIINKLIKTKLSSDSDRKAIFSDFFDKNHRSVIDEVVITFFKTHKSYTCDDVV
jgi:tRNA modification GTPase